MRLGREIERLRLGVHKLSFVSHTLLGCRILQYIFAAATAIKKESYLPLFVVVFLTLHKSQFPFCGMVKGVNSFIRPPLDTPLV